MRAITIRRRKDAGHTRALACVPATMASWSPLRWLALGWRRRRSPTTVRTVVTQLDKGGLGVDYGFAASPVTNPRNSNVYFASSDGQHVMFGRPRAGGAGGTDR